VARDFQKVQIGLTAAGTAPDFSAFTKSPDSHFKDFSARRNSTKTMQI